MAGIMTLTLFSESSLGNESWPVDEPEHASCLELRADHPLARELLLRAVGDALGICPLLRWRLRSIHLQTAWSGRENALALCVDGRTRRSPIGIAIGELSLGLYGSTDYLRRQRIATLEDALTHPIIDLELGELGERGGVGTCAARSMANADRRTRNVHESLRFALSSKGLAWLPPLFAEDGQRSGRLKRVMSQAACRATAPIHVCLPHRRKPGPHALIVVDRLAAVIRASNECLT